MSGVIVPAPQAVHFDTPSGWCFGWYHAPQPPARDLVVVLCPAVGYEAVSSYPSWVQLARHLASQGLAVFRFDYQGTGDSSGSDRDEGRVAAWRASIDAAIRRAQELSGAPRVALAGLRLGAALAVEAAARHGGVDRLLLWAPCPTGRAFVRELRATGTETPDGLLAMGTLYRADTLADLALLDATRWDAAPAGQALVIGRDDLPVEGPLPKALAKAGVDTQYRVLPGYAAMVGEPREGVLAAPVLDAITQWLLAGSRSVAPLPPSAELPPSAWRATGGVREAPVLFGPRGSLVGILSEPQDGPVDTRAGHTGIVLVNVGGNYRIGPHRVYVPMARAMAEAGHRVLRMDLAGIGDSPPEPGKPWANLYARESAADVRAAIDLLALHGCRDFVLMGICSGSYVAFQTALVDPRVSGLVLMNSRLLEWTPGKAGDSWQDSMQQYAKSTAWYRRALLRPEVWLRLLRGEIHVRLIARRFLALAGARLRRLAGGGGSGEETLLARMKRLCARGTDVLMLVSDADDGRDYVEFHFGRGGSRLRAHRNFRMAYVPEADHTFSRPGNQAFVIPALLEHLHQRRLPPRAPAQRTRDLLWPAAAHARVAEGGPL